MRMHFYLGTHQPAWLWKLRGVPLFVSHRRLSSYVKLPRATTPWALDSGGFSELSMYGEWRTTPSEYLAAVQRYDEEIGDLDWAAPQDWMCEPHILAKTGLTVADHQRRTVDNYVQLRDSWDHTRSESPFMPVLQGFTVDDYARCADLYEKAGVDLTQAPIVGIGSVCRRQATDEIGRIVAELAPRIDVDADTVKGMHGFGVKADGLAKYGGLLGSADSMAWSYGGRRVPGCSPTHANEANCLRYALAWRSRVLASAVGQTVQMQLPLAGAA